MYNMKTIKGLLLAGLIGTSGILTGCGGGSGAGTPSYWTIDVRADAPQLPINIANVGPSIGGRYTTTLYVDVKDAAGRPVPGGEVGCSHVGGLDTGDLFYLDGDSTHQTTETIDGVEITTPNAYRAVTQTTNSGVATFHFHASDVVGPATVRCTVTDAGNVVRSDEVTIQVGSNTSSGKVSQVVFDRSGPNYLFVQGFNGPTQLQLQVNVVDEAGQPIVNFPAGVNNLQLRIVPDPASLADDDATLRGVNASGQAVAGASIHIRSINGQAQFTLVSGSTAGPILIEVLTDRADNDVGNGITEAIYNYVAISAVTSAPTQAPTPTPLAISTDNPPAAVANIPYGTLLEATGGSAPYTWSLVTPGALPTGLSLNTTGVISGTPFGGTSGTYNFVVQLKDAQGTTLQKSMAIDYTALTPVPTAPTIGVTTLSAGTVGALYNSLVTASGGTAPYTWSVVDGTLPPGLSLSASGVVSGIPTAAGNYTFVLTVAGAGLSSSRSVTMTVNPASTAAPVIQTVSLPAAKFDTLYAAQLNAVGGTLPYTWTVDQLPAGLALDAGTGVIDGTPLGAGTFTFTVTVTATGGAYSTKNFTLTISP
ncbi:MAG: Ig domain-containing protein [Thiobacillus sp.]